MKKAIVLGATGGMGYSLVKELLARNIQVKAFARKESKLKELFHGFEQIQIVPGDACSLTELHEAIYGADVVFNAINLPYKDWQKKLEIITKNMIQATKANGAKLAIVDNIYSYGRNSGSKVTETTVKNPHTKKGKIRLEMERLYKTSGVAYLIAHFPDFYGPHVGSSLLGFTLEKMMKGERGQFVGDLSVAREHIYTPDGAKAMVELALHEDAYGHNWNIPASDVITGDELIEIIRTLTNNQEKVSIVTKNMLRLIGIFNKNMREFVEMQYLNEDPVILDGTKYEKQIGLIPKTPYKEGIKRTIETMQL